MAKNRLDPAKQNKKKKQQQQLRRAIAKQQKSEALHQNVSSGDDDNGGNSENGENGGNDEQQSQKIQQKQPPQPQKNPMQQLKLQIKSLSKKVESLNEKIDQQAASQKQQNELLLQKMDNLTNVMVEFFKAQTAQLAPQTTQTIGADFFGNNRQLQLKIQGYISINGLKVDVGRVEKQIGAMVNSRELEKLNLYYSSNDFWIHFENLQYLQLATYMMMLLTKRSSQRTFDNNLNSLKIFSRLYIENGIETLTLNTLQQAPQLLVDKYRELRIISTLNHYLTILTTMVRSVYGIEEFSARYNIKHIILKKPIIAKEDFLKVVQYCQKSTDEKDQLFGFCLYLLFTTAQRNETIRTVEFDAFQCIDNKYYVHLYPSKTKKADSYEIPFDAHEFVQKVYAQRMKWINAAKQKLQAKQQGPNRDDIYAKKRGQLLERRSRYLFTFFTQSAIYYHVKKIKATFEDNIKDIAVFIIHNIRKLRIRTAYEEGGLEKAQQVAQHANPLTTIRHYIDLKSYGDLILWKPAVPILDTLDEQIDRMEEFGNNIIQNSKNNEDQNYYDAVNDDEFDENQDLTNLLGEDIDLEIHNDDDDKNINQLQIAPCKIKFKDLRNLEEEKEEESQQPINNDDDKNDMLIKDLDFICSYGAKNKKLQQFTKNQ